MSRLKVCFLLATIALTSACSKIKKMGDTAEKAAENSGRAAESSARAANAAEQSREEIAISRLMQRSGGASVSRREALLSLRDDMSTFEMKVAEATKFVQAFEFQLWTGQRYDDSAFFEDLLDDAVLEFFRSLKEVTGEENVHEIDWAPMRTENDIKRNRDFSVAALAIAIHRVHNLREHVVSEKNPEQIDLSFYDVLKNALKRIQLVENGKLSYQDLKLHEKSVFDYKTQAMALIHVRMNMLLTMAYVKSTNIKELSTLRKADVVKDIEIAGNVADALALTKIKNTFNDLNQGEQQAVIRYLDGARKVKLFFDEINEPMHIHEQVQHTYEAMPLTSDLIKPKSVSTADSTGKLKNFTDYISQISNFFSLSKGQLKLLDN